MEGKEQASNALKEIIIKPRENSLFVRAEPKKAVGHKCNLIVGELKLIIGAFGGNW